MSLFGVIAGRDAGCAPKPAPDLYRRVLRHFRLQGSEAVAFEDSETGVLAAKRAGLHVVAIPNASTFHHDFASADMRLPSLAGSELDTICGVVEALRTGSSPLLRDGELVADIVAAPEDGGVLHLCRLGRVVFCGNAGGEYALFDAYLSPRSSGSSATPASVAAKVGALVGPALWPYLVWSEALANAVDVGTEVADMLSSLPRLVGRHGPNAGSPQLVPRIGGFRLLVVSGSPPTLPTDGYRRAQMRPLSR